MNFDKETLAGWLRDAVFEVAFTKKDGSVREMTCTLDPSLIPQPLTETKDKRPKTPNPDVLSVWSVNDKGWRSFRLESIIMVRLVRATEKSTCYGQ